MLLEWWTESEIENQYAFAHTAILDLLSTLIDCRRHFYGHISWNNLHDISFNFFFIFRIQFLSNNHWLAVRCYLMWIVDEEIDKVKKKRGSLWRYIYVKFNHCHFFLRFHYRLLLLLLLSSQESWQKNKKRRGEKVVKSM